MQAKKLRWGVLGTAKIADVVIKGIRMADNCELVAAASRDLAKAQAWASERTIPHAFGSYEEMLASDLIDAVYIPLPNGLHKEWSIKAAQQGKHVLCEKPLASNAAEVEEIIAAAKANNVTIMEAFMYRFHPQIARTQQLIADGAIGDLKTIRATFGFSLPDPGNVRLSKELAGGALMDVGCYCVSIARMIAGGDPVSVTASAVWSDQDIDLTLVGTLDFANGVFAQIDASFEYGGQHQWANFTGTKGRIELRDPFRLGEDPVDISVVSHENPQQVQVPGAYEYHLMAEAFASAALNNTEPPYTLQDSLGNMRTIDALYEAARIGKRVKLA